nr:type 2 lanthipeptide synthetase LanM family protein [Streptomyces sp. GC420]
MTVEKDVRGAERPERHRPVAGPVAGPVGVAQVEGPLDGLRSRPAREPGACPQETAGGRPWFAGQWWAPGLVDESPARTPDWAVFAQDALSLAPERAAVPEEDHPGLSGFVRVVAPFTACAGERMERALPAGVRGLADVTAVRADFERHLGLRLARLAARTLVLELHNARTSGGLAGEDSRARFRDFLRRTASRHGLTTLLAGYPVLARVLARAALDSADALAEMLGRLAADHAAVLAGPLSAARSGAATTTPSAPPASPPVSVPVSAPGLLTGVDLGAGDSHGGGRRVMLLRFANGSRLVYKPRPPAPHRHFNELAAWFGSLPGTPDLRTLTVLDRGRYGWVEYAEERPCASPAEVESFYRRQGALLALLHVLDGTDLHHENLIACGEHPVLVDVETLFHPPLPTASSDDPATRALHGSVYRVGLLPQLLVGDESALDLSAVGGGREAVSPLPRADWADAGTDEMRLVRRAGRFGESANLPRLDGEPVAAADHTEALCAGFRAGYDAISEAREDLLRPGGLLERFAGDEVRVVARPTWIYSTLLDESTHPDLMRDAAERHKVLSLLRTGELQPSAFPGLEDEELGQLWAGDVPLFTARPDRTGLWGAAGEPLPPLAEPGLSRAMAKVVALNTVDRQDQEWIIRASMVTSSPEPAHRPSGSRRTRTAAAAPEPERLLSAARSVGDQLVSQAYRGTARTNWIGLELLGERYWRVGPMAADLAGGYAGPALFLAQLAVLTGADRYAETARAVLAPLPGLLDALHERPGDPGAVGSGAFSGLGGIAYAVAEVARLLDDPGIGEWVTPALRLAGAATGSEREPGVRGGTAGGLVCLLTGHRAAVGAAGGGGDGRAGGDGTANSRTEAWRAAAQCADRLLEAGPPEEPGFAEGAAGVGWALLRFAEAGGGERYLRAGLAALHAAVGSRALARSGPRSEPVPRSRSGAGSRTRSGHWSWCRGRTGVALAIVDSPAALADPSLAAWARETTAELCRAEPAPDDSLCHGELGVLELLGHDSLPVARTHWVRRAGALLVSAEEAGPRCGTPGRVPHPGLLTGLAGIGHGLLRAGFPDLIPPALLLGTVP